MIAALPGASEVDDYNMMSYLSLLGPVAEDAVPAIQQSRIKNPVLRQTAIWAVNPGDSLPWLGPSAIGVVPSWHLMPQPGSSLHLFCCFLPV
jgi:hypothetical protein